MANIFDYLDWRDIDLRVEFNEVDNLILARLSYFPFDNVLQENEEITLKEAYNRYILVLQKGDYLSNSPLINRNMSYLLYANKNTDYEKFYSIYTNLLKVFREE